MEQPILQMVEQTFQLYPSPPSSSTSETTLKLTYDSRETSFTFKGVVSTNTTIPSRDSHWPTGPYHLNWSIWFHQFWLLLSLLSPPQLDVPAETYTLTLTADTINEVNGQKYCGFNTDDAQSLTAGDTGSLCIPSLLTVITLPTSASVCLVPECTRYSYYLRPRAEKKVELGWSRGTELH